MAVFFTCCPWKTDVQSGRVAPDLNLAEPLELLEQPEQQHLQQQQQGVGRVVQQEASSTTKQLESKSDKRQQETFVADERNSSRVEIQQEKLENHFNSLGKQDIFSVVANTATQTGRKTNNTLKNDNNTNKKVLENNFVVQQGDVSLQTNSNKEVTDQNHLIQLNSEEVNSPTYPANTTHIHISERNGPRSLDTATMDSLSINGDREGMTCRHSFKKKTFNKPTYCQHCTDMLWGLTNQGVQCQGWYTSFFLSVSQYEIKLS